MGLDFSLEWSQEELRRSAREFLAGYSTLEALTEAEQGGHGFSREAHHRMGRLGWLELGVVSDPNGPPDHAVDLVVLYEELGRAALPGPHFMCQLAGRLLGVLEPAGRDRRLNDLLGGDRIGTVALYEPGGEMTPVATVAGEIPGGYRISGIKSFVPYASAADFILVPAMSRAGHLDFFVLDPRERGVALEALYTLSGERQHRLVIDNVEVDGRARLGEPGSALGAIEAVLPAARLAQAAELVGLADAALEMAVEYANNRFAFGRPIGSYQAIQHKCADMVADRDAARFLTYQAACLYDQGLRADPRLAMAKAFASGAARRITKEAHQIFAGAGFVLDHRLNFYYRRAKGIEMSLGSCRVLFDEIGDLLIDPGNDGESSGRMALQYF